MAMTTVMWIAPPTQYIGRNRLRKCVGLEVFRLGKVVQLTPVNSRGVAHGCMVEIPVADMCTVVKALGLIGKED